jgi:7-cyano-7-deazaguanine synthase
MTAQRRRAIVLLSGGLDSATTLAIAVQQGFTVHALSFRYGQRHAVELAAAARVAKALGAAEHRTLTIDLGCVRWIGAHGPYDLCSRSAFGRHSDHVCSGAQHDLSLVCARLGEVLGARDIFVGVNAVDYSAIRTAAPSSLPRSNDWRISRRKPALKATPSAFMHR